MGDANKKIDNVSAQKDTKEKSAQKKPQLTEEERKDAERERDQIPKAIPERKKNR